MMIRNFKMLLLLLLCMADLPIKAEEESLLDTGNFSLTENEKPKKEGIKNKKRKKKKKKGNGSAPLGLGLKAGLAAVLVAGSGLWLGKDHIFSSATKGDGKSDNDNPAQGTEGTGDAEPRPRGDNAE